MSKKVRLVFPKLSRVIGRPGSDLRIENSSHESPGRRKILISSGKTTLIGLRVCMKRCTIPSCPMVSKKDYRYCEKHLATEKHLAIAPSSHGMGLFADAGKNDDLTTVVFKKGDVIDEYLGEVFSKSEFSRRYPEWQTGIYAVQAPGGMYIDALCAPTAASYANDPVNVARLKGRANFRANYERSNPTTLNSRLGNMLVPHRGIKLIATRNIRQGEEIMCKYGADYWYGVGDID